MFDIDVEGVTAEISTEQKGSVVLQAESDDDDEILDVCVGDTWYNWEELSENGNRCYDVELNEWYEWVNDGWKKIDIGEFYVENKPKGTFGYIDLE